MTMPEAEGPPAETVTRGRVIPAQPDLNTTELATYGSTYLDVKSALFALDMLIDMAEERYAMAIASTFGSNYERVREVILRKPFVISAERPRTEREFIDAIVDKIDDTDDILVTLSRDPSIDEMAAAIGLTLFLDRLGKHATAIYSGRTPKILEFLHPGATFEKNTDRLRDFIIALSKEKADHLRYKLEGDYVKIYVTPYKTTITPEDLDFTYGDYVRIGFIGAQDAGEPFFSGRNNLGYDFYSFYFSLKNLGRVKTLVAGRYRVRFGMGLVVNNNYGFGKLSTLSSLGRGGSNIRVHSSRSSSNYLQGLATTVNVAKNLDISGFVSYRKFDATLNKEDNTIATILSSGYHRTETEMSKKNNSSHFTSGLNAEYRIGGGYVGITGLYVSLDKMLRPKTDAAYRKIYAHGKDFYNIGIHYGYTGHRLSVSGETASGGCNAIATINTLSYSLAENLDIMALQRFYSYNYYSLLSESFSEGGSVQNESGVYVGVNWKPFQGLNVMAYSDFAYFAWPKYQAGNSSRAFDNLVQTVYTKDKWKYHIIMFFEPVKMLYYEKPILIFAPEAGR